MYCVRLSICVFLCVLFLKSELVSGQVPDICLRALELGYACEHHTIVTEDGFLLGALRLPPKTPRRGGYPVLLQHGLLDSAATWLMNELPSQNLACILHDAGFDVWLGNSRGTIYSTGDFDQTSLLPTDFSPYWAGIDMDMMARYDLPANIDFILSHTGARSLSYVGHSQGTLQAFAAFSTVRPAYASKVDLFVALAPVAFVGHQESVLLSILADLDVAELLDLFGVQDFLQNNFLLTAISEVCAVKGINCDNMLAVLCGGANMTNINSTQLPNLMRFDPGGTSVNNMVHWAQLVQTDNFQMRDWGAALNVKIYNGSSTPPQYTLSAYAGPKVALFSGGQDFLADPTDVAHLTSRIHPSWIAQTTVLPEYGHLDFVWGLDAGTRLYPDVVQLIKKHANFNNSASPFGQGPCSVGYFDVGSILFPDPAIDAHIGVFVPAQCSDASQPPEGTLPVILFSTGFGDIIPEQLYSQALMLMASQGIYVVGVDKIQLPDPAAEAEQLSRVIAWLEANLSSAVIANILPRPAQLPDVSDSLSLMCHSAGCHGVVQMLNSTCSVAKAVVLIDPVDCMDPWGIIHDCIVAPPAPLPFATPALLISTGYDGVAAIPSIPFDPPCAPDGHSNLRFYNAWQGPIWMINATDYGHGDWLDWPLQPIMDIVCATDPKSVKYPYLASVAGWTSSFVNAFFTVGHEQWMEYVVNPSKEVPVPLNTEQRNKSNGFNGFVPFCQRTSQRRLPKL